MISPGALRHAALATAGLVLVAGVWSLTARRRVASPEVPGRVQFIDVAARAGLRAVTYCGGRDKDHILESVGTGVAFVDYDQDDRLDIFLVNAWLLDEEPSQPRIRGGNILYRNLDGERFEDVTDATGLGDDAWGCGVCAGDFDNDGHLDLYVTNFGPNRLFRGSEAGVFADVSEAAGVADPGWGAGCAFFDAEGDGDLDLYVANYIDCTMDDVLSARRTTLWRKKVRVMAGPFGLRGGRDRFFLNNGDGTFHDGTDASGMTDLAEGYGLGVLASDLDNDGDVDIYVANDSNPNFFYRNDGQGHFTDIGMWNGAGYSGDGAGQAGMGVAAADLDGDGLEEIFVTNFSGDHCTLYRNAGDGFFEDVSIAYGIKQVTYSALSWGCAFVDFDLDTDQDLVILNGHIYPQVEDYPEFGETYRQRPIVLENINGKLADASHSVGPGLQKEISGRGLAIGDYDNDGDPDMVVTVIDGPPLLLRNDSPPGHHWAKVRLINTRGTYALNAVATMKAGGITQTRELRSGSTYVSQSSLILHFGLGTASKIDVLDIRWPNGRSTTRTNLRANQTITLTMPES